MVRILCFLILLPWFVSAQSSHQIVLDKQEEVEVSGKVYCLRDENGKLSIDEAAVAQFNSVNADVVPSLGFDKATYWFKLVISNRSASQWLMELSYAPLDEVELYLFDKTTGWSKQSSGDHLPVSTRIIRHNHFVFPVTLDTGNVSIFLKVRSSSSINLPITFWKPSAFYNHEFKSQFAHGLFYGILLIMVFYNLFLFFSIRDVNMLYYIFTLLAGANVIAFFQGYGFLFLYPENPSWNTFFSVISGPLFIVASGLLTRSFLNLKFFNFWLDRMIIATSIATILVVLNLMGLIDLFSLKSLHALTIINCALILLSAVYCFYKKYRPARYFLLAWVSLLLAVALFSLRNLGIIQSNWLTESALYFGGIMQTLLISLALGDRINVLTRENQGAKEKALKREQETIDLLEREVNERTEEIQQKNDELEQINTVKDKMFSVISHDLKGPLNSLKGTLSILQMNALSPEEIKQVSQKIGVQLQETSELLDQLLQWSKTQMQGVNFNPRSLSLSALIEDTTSLLCREFDQKKIKLAVQPDINYWVMADEAMMKTVLRNLLTNALKFTAANGEVKVETITYDNKAIVMVTDTGIGVPQRYREDLFTLKGVTTLGTREEKGTGIGLVLCKEFVECNGGAIWVESEEGKGSKFSFSIPLDKK
jgi:two-component system, sensor histidine kinase LadS